MVSFSSQNRCPRASIIPVSEIIQTCHLIPQFGQSSAKDLGWNAATVHQTASAFYLNPYLQHYDFFLMRFTFDNFQILRQKEEWETQQKRAQAAASLRGGGSRRH